MAALSRAEYLKRYTEPAAESSGSKQAGKKKKKRNKGEADDE